MLFRTIRRVRTIRRDFISAVGALIFLCSPAYALTESPEYFVDFNIDYLGDNPELYNITLLNSGAYFGAGEWTETPLVPGGGPQSFPMTISIPVVPTYAAFLADYTDRDNVTHVVLGVNPEVDYALFGQNWSAVFGDDAISEAELDSDLKAIHSNNTNFDDYLAAFDEITDFYYDNLTHINSPYYLPQVPNSERLDPSGRFFRPYCFQRRCLSRFGRYFLLQRGDRWHGPRTLNLGDAPGRFWRSRRPVSSPRATIGPNFELLSSEGLAVEIPLIRPS